ncbi:1734_t:CDS:2, partial [Funneliformis caledonium]
MDDEVGWVDEDEAKQLFLVLTKNMKELKLSKHPQTLYQLLNNHNTGSSSGSNFGDSSSSGDGSGIDFSDSSNSDGSNNDSFNDNFNDDKIIKNVQFNALINIIEDKLKLKNEYLISGYKLRLKAGSSILDDEDVQLKVTSYLQQHKFNTTVHNFRDYISNEILPSV